MDESPIGEREFIEALDSSRVGVWTWHIATDVIRWSKMTSELFGTGRESASLDLQQYLELIHPSDRDDLIRVTRVTLDDAQALEFSVEHRVNLPAGEERWLWGRGHIERDETGRAVTVRGSVMEVTERKRAERALLESQERVRLFAQHATDYVYEARFDGSSAVPTIVAGSFERTVGLTTEEVAQRGGWVELIHPDDRDRILLSVEPLSRGQALTSEYRIIDGAGTVRWLRDRIVPVLGADGRLERMVGGVTDITEQIALQERLAQSEKMEAVARLAGGVAHDFNNLLTILMGECDELGRLEQEPAARARSLADVQSTLRRAAQLTMSLLALGKTPHGPAEQIDVRNVVELNERVLRNAVPAKVRLRLALDPGTFLVAAQESDVQRILVNLVLNARDAMQSGEITIGLTRVVISAAEAARLEVSPGAFAELSVVDEGSGIPEKDRGRIFEPYFTTKGVSGTGLGLSSSFGAARSYGGSLELVSSGPSGTRFRLLIPLAAEKAPPPGRNHGVSAIPKRIRFALVEDEPLVQQVTARMLRTFGHEVRTFGSSEELLAVVDRAPLDFDVLVTDVGLPGIDGIELARQLRVIHPALRVLVVSGLLEGSSAQDTISSGAFAFLTKPFSRTELLAAVHGLLERSA